MNSRSRSLSKLSWGTWDMTINCTSQYSCSVEMKCLSSSSLHTSQPKRQYPAFMVHLNYNVLQREVAEVLLQTHISFSINSVWPTGHRPVAAAFGQLLCFSPSLYTPTSGEFRQMFPNEIFWNKNGDGADFFVSVPPLPFTSCV